MDLEHLPERVTQGVATLRDRTADVVGSEGAGMFAELTRLRRRVDGAEDSLQDRISDTESLLVDRLDDLAAADRATTWPRRMFWVMVGAGAGMMAAYLMDPDRGRSRRAQLSDQVASRSRDMTSEVTSGAKAAADRAKGQLMEQVKDAMPDKPEEDAKLLDQRIKSEVFGHRDDVADVVLRIDGPGQVTLKGTVPTAMAERELLASVADVKGVSDVGSELAVRGA